MAAASAATAPTVAVSAPTAAPAPIRLLVNYAAVGPSQSGLWAAYEGGYLREQGLDGELTNVPNTARAVQAMMQGDVDISMMEPATAIQISLSGADTVLLFGSVNRLLYSVMSQPAITDPQMMRGRVLGITRIGSATHSAARVALQDWGLAPDRDVALRQLDQPEAIWAALEAKQVDAAMMGVSTKILALREGYRELINLATAGPEYPQVTVNGLRSWVDANQEAVRRFARAYTQARQRLRTDKPWALGVFQKYLDTDDAETLEAFYDEVVACCGPVPYVTQEGTARLLADLARTEPRLAGRQPSEWIDDRFLREVEAAGYPR